MRRFHVSFLVQRARPVLARKVNLAFTLLISFAALAYLPTSSWNLVAPIRAESQFRIQQPTPDVPIKFDNDQYKLHEWGVFPTPRNAAWAKQDMLAEWASFPSFFRGVLPGRKLFSPSELKPNLGILIIDKPLVYIHNENMTAIDMKVTFQQGRPVVWWPPAIEPASVQQSKTTKHLRFKFVATGNAGQATPTGKALNRVLIPKVKDGHWLNHLRNVKSSRITVTGGKIPSSPSRGFAEQFIYYDGIMPAPKTPVAKRDEENILLHTSSDHDWLDVLVIERIDGRIRVSSWLNKLAAGTNETTFKFKDITANESAARATLQAELLERLVTAGLYKDEADALVKVWSPGLFERDGLQLFYRIPQRTYDQWLPLELTPKPTNIVRVGLVVHSHLEPELESRVQNLITQLGDEDYNTRIEADQNLRRIGGAAFKWILLGAKSEDAEVAARCQEILKRYDAGQFVEQEPAAAEAPVPGVRKQ